MTQDDTIATLTYKSKLYNEDTYYSLQCACILYVSASKSVQKAVK